jgi:hypothetical protein
MASERDLLATRIILNAVLPVAKILVSDDPGMKKKFQGINAKIQLVAKYSEGNFTSCFIFTDGELELSREFEENPDIQLTFSKPEAFNAFLTGGVALPKFKGGFKNFKLLIKFITLLLGMTILLPNKRPKKYERKVLKVKMVVYMITTALSQYNKGGDPEMVKWTSSQPERIYQISCEPEGIAAYLRVKAGKTKAGRGYYTRRRAFLHLKLNGAEKGLKVLMNDVELIQAVKDGYVVAEGSEDYSKTFSAFMMRIQDLIT